MEFILGIGTGALYAGKDEDPKPLCRVTAKDANSAITAVHELDDGDVESYKIVAEDVARDPGMTVREAAATFGAAGTYREAVLW